MGIFQAPLISVPYGFSDRSPVAVFRFIFRKGRQMRKKMSVKFRGMHVGTSNRWAFAWSVATAAILAVPAMSSASIVLNTKTDNFTNGDTTYQGSVIQASNSDLLQTSLDSTTPYTDNLAGGSVPPTYDGVISTVYGGSSITGGLGGGDNHYVVYNLDTSTNTQGYTISKINTIESWSDRTGQAYTVSYSTVSAPNTFVNLYTLPASTFSSTFSSRYWVSEASLTDSSGTLASNVKSIRFNFANADISWNVYREIDVIGSPVPEPASLALMGLGGLALIRRRRGGVRSA